MRQPTPERSTRRTSRSVLMVLGWLLAAALATVVAGGATEQYADEDTAYLPETDSSLAFLEERRAANSSSSRPGTESALVVIEGDSALTAEQLATVEGMRADLTADDVPDVSVHETGEVFRAPDNHAAAVDVELQVEEEDLPEIVADLRSWLDHRLTGTGLTAYVAGEAGVGADTAAGNVDLTLLLGSIAAVVVILGVVYRSPVLWLLPVLTGVIAVGTARGVAGLLASVGVTITEVTSSILVVVVFGVATDYSLLILTRLRELPRADGTAVAEAVRQARQPILISAGTVILASCSLLLASLPGLRGLGPAVAAGVAVSAAASLGLLPALVRLFLGSGKRSLDAQQRARPERGWYRVAAQVCARPVAVAAVGVVVLLGLAAPAASWSSSPDPVANLAEDSESRAGIQSLREHFGDGADAPVEVMLDRGADEAAAEEAAAAAVAAGTFRLVEQSEQNGRAVLSFVSDQQPYTDDWSDAVAELREAVTRVQPTAVVGGGATESVDRARAVWRDVTVVAPVLALLIALVLVLWLRDVITALVVVLASGLTFGAAVGAAAAISHLALGSASTSAEVILFGFVFLFAFGVDYLVFLLDAVRSASPRGAPLAGGVQEGLVRTGSVITSAGFVLAATFSMLLFVPELAVKQLGLLVAAGVLIDTFVTRTLLVPALVTARSLVRVRVPERRRRAFYRQASRGSTR